jgi:tetratricopeptide (TPR) repeat protein
MSADNIANPQPSNKRFNAAVVTLMSIVTVLSALTAFLQNDAQSRNNALVRDGQRYAVTQMETTLQNQQRENYDSYVDQQWLALSWERTLQLAATATSTQTMARLENLMQLTAGFSPLTQPPYLSNPITGTSDTASYYAEREYEPTFWRQRREAATAQGNDWNNKSSAYVTVLTLLAVSLFLFGLATTIGGRVRGAFVALGILIALVGLLWTTITALLPVTVRSEAAMQSFAHGHSDLYHASLLRSWGYLDQSLPLFQSGIDQLDAALKADPNYPDGFDERAAAYLQAGEQQVFERKDASQFLHYAIEDYEAAYAKGSTELTTLWNLGYAYYLLGNHPEALKWTNRAIAQAPQQVGLYLNRAVVLLGLGQKTEAFAAVDQGFEQAARQPISSANYYFRQTIYDLTELLKAWPNADLQDLLKDIKQKYVSLRYRHSAPVKSIGAKITKVQFGGALDAQNNVIELATSFPSGAERVYVDMSYTGIQPGSELEALIYVNDRDDDTLTVLEKSSLQESGAAWLRIITPFINAGGLTSGHYRVDIHVEGELLASGEFDVQ